MLSSITFLPRDSCYSSHLCCAFHLAILLLGLLFSTTALVGSAYFFTVHYGLVQNLMDGNLCDPQQNAEKRALEAITLSMLFKAATRRAYCEYLKGLYGCLPRRPILRYCSCQFELLSALINWPQHCWLRCPSFIFLLQIVFV